MIYRPESFLGPDIPLLESTTIPPGERYSFCVQIPGSLAQALQKNERPSYSFPTRSGCAQIGLEADPDGDTNETIIKTLQPLHTGRTYRPYHPMKGLVDIINRAERPIAVKKGTAVFRIIDKRAPSLKGNELYKAVENGNIHMTGEEGLDWRWDFRNGSEQEDDLRGIIFRLNPHFRKWIPKSKSKEPILAPTDVKNFRAYVDTFLRPIQRQASSILWIGETISSLQLNGTHVLIRPRVFIRNRKLGTSYQTNSLFLEDKRTDWRIRTEIYGPTTKEKIGREVAMQFWPSQSNY